MINILFLSFLSVLFHLFIGKIFSKYFNINNNNFYDLSLISLIGLVSLSFFALLINFFLPLSPTINTIFFIIIIIFSILTNQKILKNFISKKNILFIGIATVSIFLLIVLSNTYRPDAGLYHFPYINILNENKIILGISNLHQRFGHTSIMQYLSAIHYNFIFGLNGTVIPLASLAIYTVILFLSHIKNENNLTISWFFAILIILFICWKMNRYSGYGNDAPAHFIFFVLILIYLQELEKFSKINQTTFYLLSFFAIFAFLNKIFLIFSLLIPLISINKKILKSLIDIKFLFLFLFLFFWIIRNILTTGCMIYPMPITCFDLPWTNFYGVSNVYEVSKGSEAWAKDWSNQKENILPYEEYLKNFYWLGFWLDNHFKIILKIILPYLLLILIFAFSLKITKKKIIKFKSLNIKKYFPILLVLIIGILIWFLKSPIFRFGNSYIVSFIALSFALIIVYNYQNVVIINQKKISTTIILISVLVLSLKQFNRIYKEINLNYVNKPWPKYFSYSEQNNKIDLEKILINNEFFYYVPKSNYCFYSKSPCTTAEVDKNLKKKLNSYKYQIYYF